MKIILIRSIFAPNDYHFKKSFEGILNSIYYMKYTNSCSKLIVIGYSIPKYHKLFNKLAKNKQFELILWSVNYGKYKIINYIHDNILDNFIYCDHDILLDLKKINFKLLKNNWIGYIAFQQVEDKRHQVLQNNITINNYNLSYPEKGIKGSIANGSFFCFGGLLQKVGKLEEQSVYGLDDYYLYEKFININLQPVVLNDYVVTHPYSNDYDYVEWKLNTVNSLIKKELTYDKSIELSSNFWLRC